LAPSRDWGAKRAGSRGRVGVYACSGGGGRIIRVAVPEGVTRPPRAPLIDPCPGCDGPHRASITWREPTARDEGRQPDLILDVQPSPEPSSEPQRQGAAS
jgi:hypothetical protein